MWRRLRQGWQDGRSILGYKSSSSTLAHTESLRSTHLGKQQDPVPDLTAHPNPSNLLEWHFVLEGASGTDYEGGVYHGRLVRSSWGCGWTAGRAAHAAMRRTLPHAREG